MASNPHNPSNVMFFKYSMENICKVCRVLCQPSGNILLLGEVRGYLRSPCPGWDGPGDFGKSSCNPEGCHLLSATCLSWIHLPSVAY